MLKQKLILGVAPARRDFFSNDVVMANRDAIMKKMREIAPKYDFELVEITGLTPDDTLSLPAQAKAVCAHFREKGVNALFFPHVNFGMEEAVMRVARTLKLPTLLWGARDESPEGYGERDTDTQCGLFATGKALYRAGIPFTYIENCTLDHKVFEDGFANFLSAAQVVNAFLGSRIAQISVRPSPFLSVMVSESDLFEKFDISLVPVPVTTIIDEARKHAEGDAPQLMIKEYEDCDVDLSKMDPQLIENMSGLEKAIWDYALENNCTAAVGECWFAFRDNLGIRPCAVFGNLADHGLPVSCENDVHGALGMLMAGAVNRYTEPVFLADLTQRHPTNDNAELLWHCGPFPKSLRKPDSDASIQNAMGYWQLKDGEITLLRFDGCNGEYHLLAGVAKTVDGPETNGNYLWVEVNDWPSWEKELVQGPYIHHIIGVYGNHIDALREAARYIPGLQFHEMP